MVLKNQDDAYYEDLDVHRLKLKKDFEEVYGKAQYKHAIDRIMAKACKK